MDREKVIKGIDICLQRFRCGEDCPYYNTEKIGCMEQLREDALSLLEEQPEIVHCEECNKYDQETGRCANKTVHGNAKIWFCADGDRR